MVHGVLITNKTNFINTPELEGFSTKNVPHKILALRNQGRNGKKFLP